MIQLIPILAAQIVLWIDSKQVRDVGIEAVVDIQLAGVHRFLDKVGIVVADLGQAIGDVLRLRPLHNA